MIVFIASDDALRLRKKGNRTGLALVVPATALPVDFVAVFVILNVLFALADHDLVATTRLDELEGNVEGCRRHALAAGAFDLFRGRSLGWLCVAALENDIFGETIVLGLVGDHDVLGGVVICWEN